MAYTYHPTTNRPIESKRYKANYIIDPTTRRPGLWTCPCGEGIQGSGVCGREGAPFNRALVRGESSDSHFHLTLHMPHFVDGTDLPSCAAVTLDHRALILEEVWGWYGLAI